MRWKGRAQSDNVEDRRGASARGVVAGGGIGVVVIALLVMLLGGDPTTVLQGAGSGLGQAQPSGGPIQETAAEREMREYVGVVLKDTEDVWNAQFRRLGRTYQEPKLVLFRDGVQSACGYAQSQMGPFYCGDDQTIYIDLGFFEELKSRFGARGDFAPAYVIAHEVGHHVQKLLGTLDQAHAAMKRMSERERNSFSVRLELQADFYAGVWANQARSVASIDESDVREAIEAAQAIGDDTLQKQAQGYVVPDSFTHGTADQRMRWFLRGWETGDVREGDTFRARSL